MRRTPVAVLLVATSLTGSGCGESDAVDGPFIRAWDLDAVACAESPAGSRCYELTLDVSNHDGVANGRCWVYALGRDGRALDLSDSVAPDLDDATASHEVALVDGFTFRSGDVPTFALTLPIVDDEAFMRWQVACYPGAQG